MRKTGRRQAGCGIKPPSKRWRLFFFSFYGRDGNQMDVIFHFFKNPLRVFSANLRYDD